MCVRFRINFGGDGKNFAREVWESGYVGIWYGSWSPQDLYDACRLVGVKPKELAAELNVRMAQAGSSCTVSPDGASTALRFDSMPVNTWVFTYFERTLHLAQIREIDPIVLPQFAHQGETFKAKRIANKKSFALSSLPSSYLLVPSAGRGNVHKVPSCEPLLRLLVKHQTSEIVRTAFNALPWDEWISALGPKSWEALCFGYLIQEYGFLPTGLSVGGTLADFDIVGCFRSGSLVFAQCKGNPHKYLIRQEEEEAFESVKGAERFFFARAGVSRQMPGVTHRDQSDLIDWLQRTERGQEYLRLLRSK